MRKYLKLILFFNLLIFNLLYSQNTIDNAAQNIQDIIDEIEYEDIFGNTPNLDYLDLAIEYSRRIDLINNLNNLKSDIENASPTTEVLDILTQYNNLQLAYQNNNELNLDDLRLLLDCYGNMTQFTNISPLSFLNGLGWGTINGWMLDAYFQLLSTPWYTINNYNIAIDLGEDLLGGTGGSIKRFIEIIEPTGEPEATYTFPSPYPLGHIDDLQQVIEPVNIGDPEVYYQILKSNDSLCQIPDDCYYLVLLFRGQNQDVDDIGISLIENKPNSSDNILFLTKENHGVFSQLAYSSGNIRAYTIPKVSFFNVDTENLIMRVFVDCGDYGFGAEAPFSIAGTNNPGPLINNGTTIPGNGIALIGDDVSFQVNLHSEIGNEDDFVVRTIINGNENLMLKIQGSIETIATYEYILADITQGVYTYYFEAEYNNIIFREPEIGEYQLMINPSDLEANFTATPTSGDSPLNVIFSNQSTGNISSYKWDFENDGIYDSFEESPNHTYTTNGSYDVKLKIYDGVYVDSLIQQNYISVDIPSNIGDIVEIEYFFDNDPGFGNGNTINFAPEHFINIQTTINLNNLSNGVHRLFVRAKDENGNWSMIQYRPVLVQNTGPNDTETEISEAEYFFDADPGLGNGMDLNFTNNSIVEVNTNIDLNNLNIGMHKLYSRSKDEYGIWSIVQSKPILVQKNDSFDPPSNIVGVEYFFDIDPGIGNGIDLNLATDNIVEVITNIDLSNLNAGLHKLYFRSEDEYGVWSIVQSKPILVQKIGYYDPLPNIVSIEYFIDTDPSFGNGNLFTVDPDSLVVMNQNVALDTCSIGEHVLYIRAQDENGIWGIPQNFTFSVTQDLEIPQNLTLISNGSNLTISWDAVSGANSYRVYSSDNPNSGFEIDETGIFNGTTWSITNVNEKRFYYVTAYSASNTEITKPDKNKNAKRK